MTDDDKRVVKALGKMISDLAYAVAVYEAVGKRHVQNWKAKVDLAKVSPAFQALRLEIEHRQQNIEKLIDESNLSVLLSRLPKVGLVN